MLVLAVRNRVSLDNSKRFSQSITVIEKKNSLGMQLRLSSDDVKSCLHIQNPSTQLLNLMLLQGHSPPITFENPFFCKL